MYVGTKTSSGSPVDKAGLTNGSLVGIKITGFTGRVRRADGSSRRGRRSVLQLARNVANTTAGQLAERLSDAGDVTAVPPPRGRRLGHARTTNIFYFVTTASFNEESRLWRLTFNDVTNPAAGATIDMLIEDSEGDHRMLDNITVDSRGHVLHQEDPGNQAYIATDLAVQHRRRTASTEIAHFYPDLFAPGGSSFLTQDGSRPASSTPRRSSAKGRSLFDVQAHPSRPPRAELVEGGQLCSRMHVPTRQVQVATGHLP